MDAVARGTIRVNWGSPELGDTGQDSSAATTATPIHEGDESSPWATTACHAPRIASERIAIVASRNQMTPPFNLQRLLAEEPFVRALARRLVADDADDVVQQAYVRAIERGAQDVEDPRGWLVRVVQNLVVDLRRRTRRRMARQNRVAKEPLVPSSRELLEGEEVRRGLVAAVDALPDALRTVVLLRFYDGLPPRTIGERLSIPAATVSHRLHAAVRQLREHLDRTHGGDRRAWLAPLMPFAGSLQALPIPSAPGGGVTATLLKCFTISTGKTAALAAPLLVGTIWLTWPGKSIALRDSSTVPARSDALLPSGDAELDELRRLALIAPINELADKWIYFLDVFSVSYRHDPYIPVGVDRLIDFIAANPGCDDRYLKSIVLIDIITRGEPELYERLKHRIPELRRMR